MDPPRVTLSLSASAAAGNAKPQRSILTLPPMPVQPRMNAPASGLGQVRQLGNRHANITDEDLLALAASQADDRFTDVPSTGVASARPITLPPAPASRRAASAAQTSSSAQHTDSAGLPADITDEDLLALAASQADDRFTDIPSSTGHAPSMPAAYRPIALPPAPKQHVASAQVPISMPPPASRLYAHEPAHDSAPHDSSAHLDLDMDDEVSREWTLPALNPLDIDGGTMSVVAGGRGGLKVYCRLKSKIEDEPDSLAEVQRARGQLLAQPLSALLQQLEDASFAAALAASERQQQAGE